MANKYSCFAVGLLVISVAEHAPKPYKPLHQTFDPREYRQRQTRMLQSKLITTPPRARKHADYEERVSSTPNLHS